MTIDYRSQAGDWWPYGKMLEELADMVIAGKVAEAKSLSYQIKGIAEKRLDYDQLVETLNGQIYECKWEEADNTLDEMAAFDPLVNTSLSYYQTLVHFERDSTILDRIVEADKN